MNLNFIELLTILQLITIRNSSDRNNIKPQAMKRLVKLNKFGFYNRLLKVQLIIFSAALECTKNSTLRPLAQKGCAPLRYSMTLETLPPSHGSLHLYSINIVQQTSDGSLTIHLLESTQSAMYVCMHACMCACMCL